MLWKAVLLLAILNVNFSVQEDYITLIAPPNTYYDKPYKAYLSTSEIKRDTKIVLSLGNIDVSYEIKRGHYTSHNRVVEFNKNLAFDRIGDVSGYRLTALVSQNGKCSSKTVPIKRSEHDAFVFIQLDKPIYQPMDKIQFRVIAIDADTKPIPMINIEVTIYDSEGELIQRITGLKDQDFADFGLFESTLNIADEVNFGQWKISARINNDQRMYAEKSFPVKKYSLPFFEVRIDLENKEIYREERDIEFKIYAKYKFGGYASGVANYTIRNMLNTPEGVILYKNTIIVGAKKETVSLSIEKDLGIKLFLKGYFDIKIDLEFEEDVTRTKAIVTENIKLFDKKQPFASILNPYAYTPGITYEFDVQVKEWNGRIIAASSEPVKVAFKLLKKDGSLRYQYVIHRTIKNGVAAFEIQTTKEDEMIDLSVTYKNDKDILAWETVRKGNTVGEILRVFVDHKVVSPGKSVIVRIESPEVMKHVILIFYGRFGIMYATRINCGGEITCQKKVTTMKSWVPMVKIVAYRIEHEYEQVAFGSNVLRFDEFSNNYLNLTLSKNSGSIRQDIDLDFASSPESVVAVLGIDKSLTFLSKGHDVEKQEVIDLLTKGTKLDLEKPNDNDIIYSEFSQNFIIKMDLRNWRDCTLNETKILSKMDTPKIAVKSSAGGGKTYLKDNPDVIYGPIKHTGTNIDVDERKNFPETWIWETFLMDDETNRVSNKIPDSITTWLITAFSINSKYGLAIAEPQELVVTSDFFIEMNLPFSIKYGEILKLEVIVFNFVKPGRDMDVTLTINSINEENQQQFEFMNVDFANCIVNRNTSSSLNVGFGVPHRSGHRVTFYIRPLITKEIEIRAKATGSPQNSKQILLDSISRKMVVENEGVALFYPINQEFILDETKSSENHTFPFNVQEYNPESIEFSAVVLGDMMGRSLDYKDSVFILPEGCGEQIMSKYARTFFVYRYLKKTKKLTPEAKSRAENLLLQGYQKLMKFKKKDGGFHVLDANDPEGSTWMAAYVSRVLGLAMQEGIEPIKKEIIENALNYCIQNQNSNGSFAEISYSKTPSTPEETFISRITRFTCFVLIGILTNRDFLNKPYTNEIERAFKYIESQTNLDNYAMATCAYASALDGRRNLKEKFFGSLSTGGVTDGKTKYWNLNDGITTSADTKVLIASYAALAYIKDEKLDMAKLIISWLLTQRNPNGGFSDSHSTAIAMEALAAMAQVTGTINTDMTISFRSENSDKKKKVHVNDAKALTPQFIEMPRKTKNVEIEANGYGYSMVSAYYEYTKTVNHTSDYFDLEVSPQREIDKSVRITACLTMRIKVKDMIIMEFSLTSGYAYVAEKSDPMGQNSIIRNVETRRGDTVVDVYFDSEMEINTKQCIFIIAEKVYDVRNLKKAAVKAYEYNKKEETFVARFYGLQQVSCI